MVQVERSIYRGQINTLEDPVQTTQGAVVKRSSGQSDFLTAAVVSDHAMNGLKAKVAQSSGEEKKLALRAEDAIFSGQLRLSPNQPLNGSARFEMQDSQGVVTIEATLNERSEYDGLSIKLHEGSEAPAAMTLSNPSHLLRLPDELLVAVVHGTGKNDEGVNLNLRLTDRRMKRIAKDQMSPAQRFVIEKGQTLEASGHSSLDMRFLASQPEDLQEFVVADGKTLKASGYSPLAMQSLFGLSKGLRDFVVAHGKTLKASGYSPSDMQFLFDLPENVQKFVVAHGKALHALGYKPWDIQSLADQPEGVQQFIVTHGENLQASGHSLSDMQSLASRPQGQQDFVLRHGKALHALGVNPWNMQYLARRSKAQRDAHMAEVYAGG
jgi:hypothetical protein